jgi:hypothetical protein
MVGEKSVKPIDTSTSAQLTLGNQSPSQWCLATSSRYYLHLSTKVEMNSDDVKKEGRARPPQTSFNLNDRWPTLVLCNRYLHCVHLSLQTLHRKNFMGIEQKITETV